MDSPKCILCKTDNFSDFIACECEKFLMCESCSDFYIESCFSKKLPCSCTNCFRELLYSDMTNKIRETYFPKLLEQIEDNNSISNVSMKYTQCKKVIKKIDFSYKKAIKRDIPIAIYETLKILKKKQMKGIFESMDEEIEENKKELIDDLKRICKNGNCLGKISKGKCKRCKLKYCEQCENEIVGIHECTDDNTFPVDLYNCQLKYQGEICGNVMELDFGFNIRCSKCNKATKENHNFIKVSEMIEDSEMKSKVEKLEEIPVVPVVLTTFENFSDYSEYKYSLQRKKNATLSLLAMMNIIDSGKDLTEEFIDTLSTFKRKTDTEKISNAIALNDRNILAGMRETMEEGKKRNKNKKDGKTTSTLINRFQSMTIDESKNDLAHIRDLDEEDEKPSLKKSSSKKSLENKAESKSSRTVVEQGPFSTTSIKNPKMRNNNNDEV